MQGTSGNLGHLVPPGPVGVKQHQAENVEHLAVLYERFPNSPPCRNLSNPIHRDRCHVQDRARILVTGRKPRA